jgi:predicted nucleic acid-binding protein
MARPVVSDTSPLINVAGVGALDLLPRLYGAVSIPRHVLKEFQDGARPTDPELERLPWLNVIDAVTLDPSLPGGLGEGERATISLAKARDARLVLIDEDRARKAARQAGLRVAGTLAVLLRAKQVGYLPAISPVIQTMIAQQRRCSPRLIADILQQAGE